MVMKRLPRVDRGASLVGRWLAVACACVSLARTVEAAISIGLGGSGLLTFDTAATTNGWTTQSIGGEGDNGAIIDAATFDAQVAMLSASGINRALASTAILPPTQNNYARWNSAAANLQTRIGNNMFTVLMATLQNDTGVEVSALRVSCDVGGGGFIPEEVPGYRVYLSATGMPYSWQYIPELSTTVTGAFTATIQLGLPWAAGSLLYLFWADDNSAAGSDGYYTIDNVVIDLNGPIGVNIHSPTNGQAFAEGAPIPISASWLGWVTNVAFLDGVQLIGNDWTPPFMLSYTNALPGWHDLTVMAQGNYGNPATSGVVRISVQPRLDLTRISGTQVRISWSYPSNGCQLQVCTNLSGPSWQPVTETDEQTTGWHSVTVPLVPEARFFRLSDEMRLDVRRRELESSDRVFLAK